LTTYLLNAVQRRCKFSKLSGKRSHLSSGLDDFSAVCQTTMTLMMKALGVKVGFARTQKRRRIMAKLPVTTCLFCEGRPDGSSGGIGMLSLPVKRITG
jgi:hypothetical protein